METMRLPWGYGKGHDGHLFATTSQAEIRRRAELGEAAIRLVGALGISIERLEEIVEIEAPEALLSKVQEWRT
jgi:hypothetical protein